MERAVADHAKVDQVRMARNVSVMFAELKVLANKHAALDADQARLEQARCIDKDATAMVAAVSEALI
jgi:hypothetical protein